MLICCGCGKRFDESDTKHIRSYVGEFWGAPAYETIAQCPYCDNDEIQEACECAYCDDRAECEFYEGDDEDDEEGDDLD